MSDTPANQRLWNSLVMQAKSKFKTWPSIPASTWVRKQYVSHGGRFVDSKQVTAEKRKKEASKERATHSRKSAKKGDKK